MCPKRKVALTSLVQLSFTYQPHTENDNDASRTLMYGPEQNSSLSLSFKRIEEKRKEERKRERERERQREREREEGREEKVKDMDQCGNFGGMEVGGGGTGCGGINDDVKKKEKRRKKAYGVQVRRIMNLVINLYHK